MQTVDETEKYQAARTLFKRILGRPSISLKLLEEFFPHFKFSLIAMIIDSQMRHHSINTLLAEFKGKFDFLVKFLITGLRTP